MPDSGIVTAFFKNMFFKKCYVRKFDMGFTVMMSYLWCCMSVWSNNFWPTGHFIKGSGYRTARGSLNLEVYSNTSCNVTVTHEENAVGLVETS